MSPWLQLTGMAFVCITAGYVAKLVVSTVLRLREMQATTESAAIEARLARIEAAVDAVAIEVERAGELQRFTARLAEQGEPAGRPAPHRLDTPH